MADSIVPPLSSAGAAVPVPSPSIVTSSASSANHTPSAPGPSTALDTPTFAAAPLAAAKAADANGQDGAAKPAEKKRPDLKGKRKASEATQAGSENEGGDKPVKEKKKVKVGARASIACKTCRKRKVRCSAEWPVCSFCAQRKMPCEYEGHPAENGGSYVAGPAGLIPQQVPAVEAELPDAAIILEALEVFYVHYYDIFPFLHRPTLESEINSNTASKELMCCILALAARFCQPLRDLHPTSSSTLSSAPEHYSRLASELLSLSSSSTAQTPSSLAPGVQQPPDTPISLLRCQCLLILGFYELTAGRDNSGWLKLGSAIRMAQILRLGFEDEIAYMSENDNDPSNPRGRFAHDPLKAEIRRRTFWSLFALDRTVSDGNERPCGLKVPRIATLRMPGPDADFVHGGRALGAKFDPNPPEWSVSTRATGGSSGASSAAENEHELEADLYGYSLRIADIWANVASYIGSGGRNVDRRPPWQEDSTFAQLARELTDFEKRLPEVLKYSQQTMLAHCMGNQMEARMFGMLHLLNAGARHVLHRDYLPFLPPLDFNAANGPVDGEPLFGDVKEPSGWWQRNFDLAAESANMISDIASLLSGHGIVLTHPFAGFAAVAAGTVHCHCLHWPASSSVPLDANHYFGQDVEILNRLRGIYPIAERWYEGIAGLSILYYNLARGVLDADPVKVRARLLQLMRSVKESEETDAPEKPSPTPLNGTGAAARQPAVVAATTSGAMIPSGMKAPFSSASPGGGGGGHARTLSQALDALIPSPAALSSTPSNGLPTHAHTVFGTSSNNPDGIHPLPPSTDPNPSNPFADLPTDFSFDLAAMQGGLGGLGLGLNTLDEWGGGYLWGGGGNSWGLAGFGGLGGAFPAPPTIPGLGMPLPPHHGPGANGAGSGPTSANPLYPHLGWPM
ncbi:hypothetical protein JCM11251_001262 [Rhodosporidiobolus azoricus]